MFLVKLAIPVHAFLLVENQSTMCIRDFEAIRHGYCMWVWGSIQRLPACGCVTSQAIINALNNSFAQI